MQPAWLNKSEYPFQSRFYNVAGHKLHYIDEGEGPVILFVHGTPSWSFEYRNIIKALRANFRCIAIDHIGFGLSDKPRQYDYSTQNHSKMLERFILDMQLDKFHLVVHDFGGPITLAFAISYPDKINKLVVLNSWLWSSKNDLAFIKYSKLLKSPLLPFLYRYLNFSAKVLLPKSFGDNKLSKTVHGQYTKPFAHATEREGPLSFAKSLLCDQDWFEELWNKRETINKKPTLFIWGMKDPFLKADYLKKYLSGFPNAQAHMLETCGHFPQEEEPEVVANLINSFLKNRQTVVTL